MRRREAKAALAAAVCVLTALLSVFAIELSDTQAKSKGDVTARVHERAVLAAALIDSLFGTINQQIPRDSKLYGTSSVSALTLVRQLRGQRVAYAAVLGSAGQVLAATPGFTAQARAGLSASRAIALSEGSRAYGLGNAEPYGDARVIDYAVSFPTRYGPRLLVTGFPPSTLGGLFGGELRKIPGVRGSHNYLIDGSDTVLSSTNPRYPAGYRFTSASQVRSLGRASGQVAGRYYDQVRLAHSTWRVVLVAPVGPLFASVSGLRKWIPWAIFLAFALVAIAALGLARRMLRQADQVRVANAQLEVVNRTLGETNAALERRATELARSNAELEQFASIASHDLQEPLRKVRTFTQQLTVIEADRLSDKGLDYLLRANSAAERMQRLIEDLLKFSRVATHGRPFADVDLREVADEVIDDLGEQVRDTNAVVHVGNLPTIRADALQMRQLLQNLVSNALKFARPGVAPHVWLDASLDDEQVSLTVRDNGIGFEPRYERRIFRVFERLHGRSEYPGTGIGLALCRKIVERHGGAIIAQGVPGEGATFTATMPRHLVEEVVVASRPASDEHDATAREEAHVGA